MKKFMTILLGMSLALGCVSFAEEAKAEKKETKKVKKAKKAKKTTEEKK
jgi:hypothetical protein